MDAEIIKAIGLHIVSPLCGVAVLAVFVWWFKD